jgi:hypothetical protein
VLLLTFRLMSKQSWRQHQHLQGRLRPSLSSSCNAYGSSVTVKKRVTVSQLRYTQKAIDDSKLVEGKVKFKDDCTAKANYKWINPTYPMSITGVITHLLSGMSHQVPCKMFQVHPQRPHPPYASHAIAMKSMVHVTTGAPWIGKGEGWMRKSGPILTCII